MDEAKKFTAWRRRVNARLPDLVARVFALRGRMYAGCGTHYALECELGTVLARINNYSENYYHGPDGMARQTTLRIKTEMLFSDVRKAEQSAAEWAAKIWPESAVSDK
jgi:hypothetical protein